MTPAYQKVKQLVRSRIHSGQLRAGDRVPSENELARRLRVSRMTANRALRELADEGLVVRVAGLGSFVADPAQRSHPLEVRNIAEEIRARGNVHSVVVHAHRKLRANGELAASFGLKPGAPVYHSVIVHLENGQPLQVEDRHVNPAVAPGYADIDLQLTTPNAFLIEAAPLQKAEQRVRALMPDPTVRRLLELGRDEPSLVIFRRTWSGGRVASTARLFHAGARYELAGDFTPPP